MPLSDARDFVEYWASSYDWRRLEAEINSFGNYRTRLDGVGIHFIHAESPHANAPPLILTHGWPGSIVEFLDCIGPLVDPVRYGGSAKDAFHVIIPSLLGFGFSDRPGERGWNYTRIARAWVELMNRLGYEERWAAQGGRLGLGGRSRTRPVEAGRAAGGAHQLAAGRTGAEAGSDDTGRAEGMGAGRRVPDHQQRLLARTGDPPANPRICAHGLADRIGHVDPREVPSMDGQ